jgi:four helix bundle protein
MNRNELEERTKKFHLNVIWLCSNLPRTAASYAITKQIIRSAGSVGANYRVTIRAKSKADYVYKMEIVLEEIDESLYWLEILKESGLASGIEITNLIKEASELTSIFAATVKTLRLKNKSEIRHPRSDINRKL